MIDTLGSSVFRKDIAVAWSIFAVILTLPFQPGINSSAIVLAAVVAFAFGDIKRLPTFCKHPLITLWALYLVLLLIYSFVEAHFGLLTRSLSFIVLPAIFFIPPISALIRKRIFQLYVLAMIGLTLYNVVYTIAFYPLGKYTFYDFSGELAKFQPFSTNYIALFASFACIILFDTFFTTKLFKKVYTVILLLVLMAYLMVLGSRTAFFGAIIIMIGRIAIYVLQTGSWKTSLFAAVFFVIGVVPIAFVPYFNQRVTTLFTVGFEADPRYYEFSAAVEVFKQKPWFGHGYRKSEEAMVREFEKIGFHEGVDQRYNAHNQFLQTAIDFGIVGLILLCALYGMSFREALQKKQFLPLAFMLLFAMCSLTESVLVRNKGIIFYALFAGILLIRPREQKEV